MPALLLAGFALLLALVGVRQRRKHRSPAQATIVSPPRSSVIARDGAVRSVQAAELTLDGELLERIWTPENLENLAATYWRFLSRVTLGVIRVVHGDNDRRVVFLVRPLTLLRFDPPDYLIESGHGKVTWRIRDGLLVARSGRGCGFLAIEARRLVEAGPGEQARVRIELEVANFYPAISVGFSEPVYEVTQSAIHVLVTHAFLRSLARLDLAKSKVGRLAGMRARLTRAQPQPAQTEPRRDGPADRSAVANAGQRAQLRAVVPRSDPTHGA